MITLTVVGCAVPEPGASVDASSHSPTTTDAPSNWWMGPSQVVPIAEQELLFTVEPSYEIGAVLALDDFDGDGSADAVLELDRSKEVDSGTTATFVIVRGPFTTDTRLPTDAWITVAAEEIGVVVAEVNGLDGVDLILDFGGAGPYAGTTWIVPFPYDGALEPGSTWVPFDPPERNWSVSDVDKDGTGDLVLHTAWDEIHVTWGPYARWAAAPDVIVAPLCRGGAQGSAVYGPYASSWWFPGDLDGDGMAELVVPPYGQDGYYDYDALDDCGGFTVSLPFSGVVDPSDPTTAFVGLHDPVAHTAGDWTGDGLEEVLGADSALQLPDTLLLSPITLSAGDLTQYDGFSGGEILSNGVVSTTPGLNMFEVLDVDLGGDGVMDAFGRAWNAVVVFPAEPTQLSEPSVDLGWELRASATVNAYVDAGIGWLAIVDTATSTVRRIDLGPATSL